MPPSTLSVLARDLLGLVLPVACGGCGLPDVPWCDGCDALLAGPPWRCEERAGRLDTLGGAAPFPVWTLTDNLGPARAAVVAWKDGGRLYLTSHLARALTAAAWEVRPVLGPGPVLLVAVPSAAAARRRRGAWVVDDLARGVARALAPTRRDVLRVPALRRRGRARDQVGLGVRDRGRNLEGRVVATRRGRRTLPGATVLLLDDVLTTGASLAASAAAVRAAGGRVAGALTLASTPAPGTSSVAGADSSGSSGARVRRSGVDWVAGASRG
ncbi:ComF family protein [Cellulomonas fimi]|uniref:ComF family protein n=1 Tax=Cellulomonas fimi TaxID=1708 RepID=UPI0002D5B533|nr:ComF family protein [Cellulomonas fimi]